MNYAIEDLLRLDLPYERRDSSIDIDISIYVEMTSGKRPRETEREKGQIMI